MLGRSALSYSCDPEPGRRIGCYAPPSDRQSEDKTNNPRVCGEHVIYDPQSSSNLIAFSASGSTAKHLAIVANLALMRAIAFSENGVLT